jgi:predicted membrane-bound dolichyl-phosphate-mannose-protein mannosyltransferase
VQQEENTEAERTQRKVRQPRLATVDKSLRSEPLIRGETAARKIRDERANDNHLTRAFSFARRTMIVKWAEISCFVLLLLMIANMLGQISRKSITNDEIVHIPAGYYHLVAGNFQLNNEHPPLVKMLAALPLMLIQPVEPPLEPHSSEIASARTLNASEKFWRANAASAEAIMFWTRVPMIVLAASLGALIFIYTRKLFDRRAALFAVALYSFEPTVLAHGRVVHTDLPAALAFLLFVYVLHSYMDAPDNFDADCCRHTHRQCFSPIFARCND